MADVGRIIANCCQCAHFKGHWDRGYFCNLMNREIKSLSQAIPDWCPWPKPRPSARAKVGGA